MQWRLADRVEIHFRGHKGDQEGGEVRVHTRDEVRGPYAGYRANGGAVALVLELMSCYATLPADAPLSSYRDDRGVKIWKYNETLRALREIVEKSGRDPRDLLYIR